PQTRSIDDQIAYLLRGTAAVYSEDELRKKLTMASAANRPLRVKLGLDPTRPDIHLGHAVVLKLLRRFQNLGHKAVCIVGDYTTRIGDPSGRSKTRPMLTPDEIDANARTYLHQATKILDPDPERLEMVLNSQWLSTLGFDDVIRLTSQVTVAQMLERDTFANRYKAGQPISLHEFLYPLVQAWDSVSIRADVELGGTDQTFNNLMGRQIQAAAEQEPQVVIVCPILRGLDGQEKMSKSLDNYIAITDSADDMYGKTMSIPDELMSEWFDLLTDIDPSEIKVLCDGNRTHPRDAKDRLARHIVTTYHGVDAADAASAAFRKRFSEGEVPEDLEAKQVPTGPIGIVNLVREVGFAKTNSEARRLVAQGAVSLNGEKINDANAEVTVEPDAILKVGKRRMCRLVPGDG
ncbi:MAG: tyrosine--tRNA ligase, partial [Planctomycetota bacterium]